MIKRFLLLITLSVSVHATPDIQHWRTEAGARVYFVAAPELPMVDINMTFDAGAARDGDLPGLARLTNAMLNKGAGGMTADGIATAFADSGAQFSHSAHRDMATLGLRTLTYDKALDAALKTYRTVLTQPDFPNDAFSRLKKQTMVGLRAEDQSPAARARRAYYKHLFAGHPYATMPSGNKQSIVAVKRADIKAFYQRYYVASNAILVIVGALDKDKAVAISETLLADLPAGTRAPLLPDVKSLDDAKTVRIDYPSSQTHILMGQPAISQTDADYFALYVGNHILGGSGLVSRLNDEIREKRGLSYSAYSFFNPMRKQGPYQFGLQTRNDQADEALQVMKSTLHQFIKAGPTLAELKAAKQNITGGFALRLDSNSKIAAYVNRIGFYNLPLNYLATFNDKVNQVTIKDIKDAYKRRIDADNMVTVVVGGD